MVEEEYNSQQVMPADMTEREMLQELLLTQREMVSTVTEFIQHMEKSPMMSIMMGKLRGKNK